MNRWNFTFLKDFFRGLNAPSVILNGISGSGKSLMLKLIHAELGPQSTFWRTEDSFDEHATLFQNCGPCAILIDNFDKRDGSFSSITAEQLSRFV